MMRRIPIHVLFVAWLSAPAWVEAGQVSGTIREGAKPLANATIVVRCGAEQLSTVTDQRGRYRLYLPLDGRCRFELPEHRASTDIFSSAQPLRQDFSLNGGNLQAR